MVRSPSNGADSADSSRRALRGSILHFLDDPRHDPETAVEYLDDGLLLIEDGQCTKLGPAAELLPQLDNTVPVDDHRGRLILPGFIDAHTHFVQADIIGSFGARLIDWLDRYAFPAEQAFADPRHADAVAAWFLDELLRNGTTTALAMCSVHPASVHALFGNARRRGMRLIAGKVMMDRNCPAALRDSPQTAFDESQALIESWHGRDRLLYAISPRFACTSSDAQLALAGQLAAACPEAYVHTHLAENEEEVAWIRELFPGRRSYLDVYEHHGLLRRRSVFAHGIWLDDVDRTRLQETGAGIAHCPTCNLFMGSGLFDLAGSRAAGVALGLGSDIGGGTSFSMLRVMHEAYKVAQLRGDTLDPLQAFYLVTRGAARLLDLDHAIGSFAAGREADVVVLDPEATPLLARRMALAENLQDRLFLWMMLGDERAIHSCYLAGNRHE